LPNRLLSAAERLAGAQIDSSDYREVFRRFDRPTTFFYCDPPYVGVDLYRRSFAAEQFAQLSSRCRR
jgi:DNA adenine methylase